MASCLLMSVAQLLGHRGNQPLWPCKCFSTAEHLPLLPVPWCTWLLALGSHQPSDFQRMPALDSWLGFLVGQDGRSELAPSKRDGTTAPLATGSLQTPGTVSSGSFAAGGWGTADTQPINPALFSRAESWIKSQSLFSFLRSTYARYGTS